MNDIDEKVLLAGYYTIYLSIFNSCGHCYKLFEQASDRTILIYEAEDKDKLTKEDLENDSDDENKDDNTNNLIGDSKNIEINKKEKIELDLQNAISKINIW
ncbi:hypothetical protein F8M41_010660 [Gigaspora margarita]|uniref:Uncharacterized protein n=1 Tax=Gigaspora margarita TaxID=4874 RepID=A0A8H4A0U8_GIGMA|nr:hypothetical protein F8M41_010660 [Gigaspora margarita]